jgi:hypothetical protein
MKRIISTIAVLLIVTASFAQNQVIADPNAQKRDVSSFHAIEVSHAIDLFLSQGNEEAVAVSAKTDEYRDHIKTVVENGVLKIYYDEEKQFWKNTGNKHLKAYVSFKNIDKLKASGASDVTMNGTLKGDALSMNMSGASDFKGSIAVRSLNVDLSGASDVTIDGKADDLVIEVSGASDFKGYDLETENCKAHASGASDIKVTVNKELEAQASGASGVYYKGNGVIRDLKSSGASSISKKS